MTLVKSAVLSLHQEHGLTYMLSVRDSRSQWAEQGFQQPGMDLKHFSIFQVFGNAHPGRASLWFSAAPPNRLFPLFLSGTPAVRCAPGPSLTSF